VILFNIFFAVLSSVIFPHVLTIVLLPIIEPRDRCHLEGKLLYRTHYSSCICNICLWRYNKPCTGLLQFQSVEGVWGAQISRQLAHECGNFVSSTHRPISPPWNILGTLCWRLSLSKSHSAAGRIMSMKNSTTNVKCGKFYLHFCFTNISRRVSYRILEVRWFSAQQCDTLYRMPQQIFLAYFVFST
jgi:hypothetical protein